MQLYLIRHCEFVGQVEDRYAGIADFPLTQTGREQASALGKHLQSVQLQVLFTSPLARAHETARLMAQELTPIPPVVVVEALQEQNAYGILSGVKRSEAIQLFGHLMKEIPPHPGRSPEPLPGAEPFETFLLRVHQAFHHIVEMAQRQHVERVAIVTHGGVLLTLFEHVLRVPDEIHHHVGAVNVVEYQPAQATLSAFFCAEHP
ncbi:histidine phosphatase family protein [Ktedonobacter racemifer]|uniref:Phosphoglycerate mutase n=1 Tax=Ktedonobacter racemifer DSM 44963 TaxID=485913 RepID=D6U6B0_KTERA|nr:histidine phosphatase family protein [Ktedonobacter racemifer]EFH80521.1 Phosphoglycerate mutase [Ktedonobacter racemifer DSM 44963]